MEKIKKIPVVVVLGHIDHGKSSLLEAIRKDFKITEKESGGITQHIGAYEITFEGKKMTFIDTPGHEAFSEMRSRGAKVADLAILVVAADEGVKVQTKEAIEVIREAKIPFLVAINKIDKENANPQMVKAQLQKEGVLIEEWGGDIPAVEVSAKTGQGINDLLTVLSLLAEMNAVEVSLDVPPRGFIIESYLDSRWGPTATVILEEGKLKVGDVLESETSFGKVRKLFNFEFKEKEMLLPGEAGIIIGFKETPGVGENIWWSESVEKAEENVEARKEERKEKGVIATKGVEKYLKIVLKADVFGTLEVLTKILKEIKEGRMGIKIIKTEVGEITDSDVRLAESEEGVVIGFRVKPTPAAKLQAQSYEKGKLIYTFDVIYDVIDGIRKLLKEKYEKKPKKVELGKVEVIVVFKTQKKGERRYWQIVGGRVIEGEIEKGEITIERKGELLPGGKILEMQERKKVIEKAGVGKEIGISYEGKTKIKINDKLIVHKIVYE